MGFALARRCRTGLDVRLTTKHTSSGRVRKLAAKSRSLASIFASSQLLRKEEETNRDIADQLIFGRPGYRHQGTLDSVLFGQ